MRVRARHAVPHDLAGSEVIIEAAPIDARRVDAVVARRVGVGAEMNRRVQRGQRDVVAAVHVAQHFDARAACRPARRADAARSAGVCRKS